MTNPKTRRASPTTPVSPSTKDPVQRWLDVFIPMTGLPRHRAEEIRAELDDHLRARVDDLMITGLSEPEAVQRAVEELGETAHLARQFRTALQPRRRTLMHAALITTAGAAIALGVTTFTGLPRALPAAPVAAALTQPSSQPSNQPSEHAALPDVTLDLGQTWADAFASLERQADRPVLVHWSELEDIGLSPDSTHALGVDRLPANRFFTILAEKTREFDPVVAMPTHDLIEISVQSQFDRRTMQVRAYDIADLAQLRSGRDIGQLVPGTHQPATQPNSPFVLPPEVAREQAQEAWAEATDDILETVQSLAAMDAWYDHGGDLANGRASGASLLIEAPARIHEQVEHVLTMMRADAEQTRRLASETADEREQQQRQAREARQAEERERTQRAEAERREQAERLQAEMQELLDRIVAHEATKRELESEHHELTRKSMPHNRIYLGETEEEAERRREEYSKRLATRGPEILDQLNRIEAELTDARAYRDAVRARYIALRWTDTQPEPTAAADRPIDPEDFRRPDGSIDYDALRAAARLRAAQREAAERQGPRDGD